MPSPGSGAHKHAVKGKSPPRSSPLPRREMRPLTACCARYHGRGRGDRGSAWRSSSNKLWRKRPCCEAGPWYSAGRALGGCGRFLRYLLGASNSRQRRSRHAARGHRRHTGRPRTIGQLCCSDSPQGCSVICGGAGQRAVTQTRSRRAVLRAPSATRLRSLPSAVILGASMAVGSIPTEVERRPAALADRPEARGLGEKRASAVRSRSPQSPKETAQPAGAPATGEKTSTQQPKHTPVAAGNGASDPKKVCYFHQLDRGGDGCR
jgi:hypothetical protein